MKYLSELWHGSLLLLWYTDVEGMGVESQCGWRLPLVAGMLGGMGVKANIGDKVISLSSLVSHSMLEKGVVDHILQRVPVSCLRN